MYLHSSVFHFCLDSFDRTAPDYFQHNAGHERETPRASETTPVSLPTEALPVDYYC
jgi:hypothetical protein